LASKARELQALDPSLFLRVIGIDATPREDFRAVRAAKKVSTQDPPKYADGAGNTWIGRGPRPKWLKEAIGAGRALDEFLTTR
jgi:DNA-binding protein H-NS